MTEPLGFATKAPMMLASIILSLAIWILLGLDQPVGYIDRQVEIGVLGYEKWENKYVFPEEFEMARVRIEGPQDQLESEEDVKRVIRQSLLSVFVDLTNARVGNNSYPLQIQYRRNLPFTFTLLQQTIKIDLEMRSRRRMPVVVEAVGKLPEELKVNYDGASAEPSMVLIDGPAPYADKVKKVRVFIDLSEVSDPEALYGSPEILDENDRPVPYVDVDPKAVKLLPALAPAAQTKTVVVLADIQGEPAAGYVEVARSIEPNQIALQGTPDALARLRNVSTLPISLNGINKTNTFEVPLQLPAGVKAYSSRKVKVTVTIEPRGGTNSRAQSVAGP